MLKAANAVVAFLVGGKLWLLPIHDYADRAADPPDRQDGRLYITIGKHRDWLSQFEGNVGIRHVFLELLR